MAGETASDILAGLLGIGTEDARRLLDRFSGGLTAELLDRRQLSVDGLGRFSIVHEQPVREKTASGTRYLPPKNTVRFDARSQASGETAAIAVRRLDMAEAEARRLAKALSGMFEKIRNGTGRVELRGFGSLTMASGAFRFLPDASLEEMLNSAYDGLHAVVIPERQTAETARARIDEPHRLKMAALFVALVSVLASGWFLYRQLTPGHLPQKPAVAAETVLPVTSKTEPEPKPLSSSGSRATRADSLLFSRGRFTIIVATFSTRNTARQEIRRFSAMGHRMMIWPVRHQGERYFRLVVGDFATRQAALDSMKHMPRGLPANTYIQQASNNVVLYGE